MSSHEVLNHPKVVLTKEIVNKLEKDWKKIADEKANK